MGRCWWFVLPVLTACATPAGGDVHAWGTLREVLREGHAEARVVPAQVATPDAVGVGALRDLAGEITVTNGRVLVAIPSRSAQSGQGLDVENREATDDDAAALLVLADVPVWEAIPLGDCDSYGQLEDRIAEQLRHRAADLTKAQPVRVRGRATHLALHVIAGACPIAHPTGPAPWRFSGAADAVELVGFYAEGATGRLTHHGRRSHLHAVTDGMMGHLDEVTLADAVLWLPAR